MTSKNFRQVSSYAASMAATNPEAVPRKLRRDSLALAAQVSTRSLICSPMWPARKNEVPCSSGVIGPRVVRLYPLKYSKTFNSIGTSLWEHYCGTPLAEPSHNATLLLLCQPWVKDISRPIAKQVEA